MTPPSSSRSLPLEGGGPSKYVASDASLYTGVLKSSDSGTNFLVPKVNLAPQDWFLEIYC